jgi:hypothetical protein
MAGGASVGGRFSSLRCRDDGRLNPQAGGVARNRRYETASAFAADLQRYLHDEPVEARPPSRAHQALAWVKQLYAIEDKARDYSADQRRELRQTEARPVLAKLKAWLAEQEAQVLPKSGIGKAIGYVVRQWQALQVYLDDGDIPIDNNAAERGFRGIALGRRNCLFLGSDEAGASAAVCYGVVASCEQVGVEPYQYLQEVLRELPKLGRLPKELELESWLPQQWAKRQAEPRGPPPPGPAADSSKRPEEQTPAE